MSGVDLLLLVLMVAGLVAAGIGVAALGHEGYTADDVKKGIALAGTVAGIFGVAFTFYKLV